MTTRILALATFLTATATGAALADCSSVDEAVLHLDRAQAAYFSVSADLKPEQHTMWSEALRDFQSRIGQSDYQGACEAIDSASKQIGL